MRESDYYAPGSYNDPSAPWNEVDVPEKEFDVICSQSLSRTATVWTNNYIPGASGVDYEPDDEGGYCACGWQDDDDTSDTCWGDEYKTTKILLRRIDPGTVLLYGGKPVTLTKPFYIGVFEITQKQYQLVTGSNPSSYRGDMRPVERVSWNDIRGNSSTYDWPNVTTVDSTTFIGKIQAKTGLTFDLPTGSQWEYACRAGMTSSYNNGESSDNDLKQLGRFLGNQNDGRGDYSQHTTVGSYSPNAWGLYDMHGNVYEWCLDWYSDINNDPVTDYPGAASGSCREQRGGSWNYYACDCTSYSGNDSAPSYVYDRSGFRLSRTLANE